MPSSSDLGTRTARSLLLSYGRTSLFCAAIGFTIWLLGLAEPLWAALFVSFTIGYSFNTVSVVLHPVLVRNLPPLVAAGITTIVGLGVGLLIAGYSLTGEPLYLLVDNNYGTAILGLFFGVLGILFFTTQDRLEDTQAELAVARAEQLNVEKEHLETQLKLLQAQIEPHFLFNTLSNVVGMIRDQPAAAEKTLIDLTTLLRASLKRTRTEETTLGDEIAIISALLEINQIRMGNRLSWSIEMDDALKQLLLPPMLLQPLVENAVKHGIEPLEEGGAVDIRVSQENERLVVSIADTGAGAITGIQTSAEAGVWAPNSNSSGVGVANVQSRLATLFGTNASLTLADNKPRGMVATLSLPASLPGPNS